MDARIQDVLSTNNAYKNEQKQAGRFDLENILTLTPFIILFPYHQFVLFFALSPEVE